MTTKPTSSSNPVPREEDTAKEAFQGHLETFSTAFLGVDALCFSAGQLGEPSHIQLDRSHGTKVAWTEFNEDDPRPMVKLHLRPGAERAEIEHLPSTTFYTLCGWFAVHGLDFHIVSTSRFADDACGEDDGPDSFQLMRLSIPRERIDAVARIVRARGGERVKPAQVEGAGLGGLVAKHAGALVVYHVENGDPDRLRCGLLAADPDWLNATANAIAAALGEPRSGPGEEVGGVPGRQEPDADG